MYKFVHVPQNKLSIFDKMPLTIQPRKGKISVRIALFVYMLVMK